MKLGTWNEELLPSSLLLHRNAKNTNATLECLPPVAERKARNPKLLPFAVLAGGGRNRSYQKRRNPFQTITWMAGSLSA